MNKRISLVRKENGLNQEDFAERLGLTKNFISLVETGKREPSDRTIKDICREFNVNEAWLREGNGEMLLDVSREEELAELTKMLFMEEPDSFKNRLVSALAKLKPEQWDALETVIDSISAMKTTKKE